MREEQDELSAQYADSLDQVHTSFAKELGALRAADQAAADAALLARHGGEELEFLPPPLSLNIDSLRVRLRVLVGNGAAQTSGRYID